MKNLFILLSVLALFASSCDTKKNDSVMCTEIFVMVGVEIEGKTLDSFYTIDVNRGQKIYHTEYQNDNWYPVATDMLLSRLKSSQDEFLFVGYISGEEVIREKYIIGADQCHIFKVSGPEKIEL